MLMAAAADELRRLLGAAADGDHGTAAAQAVHRAAVAAIAEAAAGDEGAAGTAAAAASASTYLQQQYAAELAVAYGEGFDALADPALDEAVLVALLGGLQRIQRGVAPAGLPACGLLSAPPVSALCSALCRRAEAAYSLPRVFPRYQSELCAVCVHLAVSDQAALARDVLDAAQVFVHSAQDPAATKAQLGEALLAHTVAAAQQLRLGQGDPARLERLVELVGSSASHVTTDALVQLFERVCLTLGASSLRAADDAEAQALRILLRGLAANCLKLRQDIYSRTKELLALASRPAVRELCLRLMVEVVGTQRATIVSELSKLLRCEHTIAMRHTSLTLIRSCFDDAYTSYIKETDFSLADDDDGHDDGNSSSAAPAGISASLETALRKAATALRTTAADDASPKVRRAALEHAVAIAINLEKDPCGGIKLAASRCFDTAREVRVEALAQLTHAMARFPAVVSGLRPPVGLPCTMPWHDLVLQLLAHQNELLSDAEATAKLPPDGSTDNRAVGDAADERLRSSETTRQVAYVCETVLTQPALLGLREAATIDTVLCSLRLTREERQLLGKALGRTILRLSNAQERRQQQHQAVATA